MLNNNTKNNFEEITLFLKKMTVYFLTIITAILVGFSILYSIFDTPIIKILTVMCAAQHIIFLLLFLAYKDFFKEISLEPLIYMYLAYIIMALYPIVCIFWNSGYEIAFFWYALVPIGIIAFHVRNITVWIIITVAVVFSIFFLNSFFPKITLSYNLLRNINIITIASTIVVSAFFATMFVAKAKIDEAANNESLRKQEEKEENLKRDKILYNNILEYLEKNKPFKDPNFNERTLAQIFNTNENYISRAISAGENANFNSLINKFRINYAKYLLDSDAVKKYTIEYIYTESGYEHRSTFNRAFKSVTGMTPSNYISRKNRIG